MKRFAGRHADSFAMRLFISFSVAVLLGSMLFFSIHVFHHSRELMRFHENRGRMLSLILARESRTGIISKSARLLKNSADNFLQNPNVTGIRIYSDSDSLLFEYSKNSSDSMLFTDMPSSEDILRLQKNNAPMPVVEKETMTLFFAPVMAEPHVRSEDAVFSDHQDAISTEMTVGYVVLAMDKTSFIKSIRNLMLEDAVIGMIFVLLGGGVIFWSIRRFTRPLERLSAAVRSFGEGLPFEKLPVSSNDEIGRLTDAFNTMAEALISKDSERKRIEARFRQSQKMETVGTLAGGIAHDFKNILTAIIGFANIVKMDLAKDDPSREYVEHILSTSGRATKLVQSLLAFSRQQVIDPKPINLNEIIRDIQKMLKRLVMEDIGLQLNLAEGALVVRADKGMIDQVLMNLCTNARDAMPNGGVLTIATSARKLEEDSFREFSSLPGMYAEISVADTGIGMDAATAKRVFDPFFTTKEVGKGTGLGLSIVYGIVKQHEGYIDVKSEPDKGTVFMIYLPLIKAETEKTGDKAEAVLQRGTETILVAEDDDEVRLYIRDILRLFGYKVIEAADGQEALNLLEGQPDVDLLILDVIMPAMNGREVFDAVRKRSPEIKALFLSGYSDEIVSSKGIIDEGINFMGKPVAPEELLAKIRRLLDQ